MCVCSVLAPHGRPAPPAPATRLSHHQRQAHDHSRRDARAAVHLSLQSAPIAQAPAPSSGTIPHRSATRPARRFTARRARRHAARAGHRARAPPPDQSCCTTCCRRCSSTVLNPLPACSALRPSRLAPDATQIRHRAGAHARPHARARARASALCCTDCQPAHTAYSTMGTHTPNDAARTPQQ